MLGGVHLGGGHLGWGGLPGRGGLTWERVTWEGVTCSQQESGERGGSHCVHRTPGGEEGNKGRREKRKEGKGVHGASVDFRL